MDAESGVTAGRGGRVVRLIAWNPAFLTRRFTALFTSAATYVTVGTRLKTTRF